jgi:hypothetical protein
MWYISSYRSESPTHAWRYGGGAPDWDYDTGAPNSGWLMSPPIDLSLCTLTNAHLRFWSWYDTEEPYPAPPNRSSGFDIKKVQITTNGGASWSDLYVYAWPANLDRTWEHIEINLAAYIGQTIQIRFFFDTVDDQNNAYEGWWIDDVTVGDFPIDATLMVRLREAASITFDSGGSAAPINRDTVVGQTSGAIGKIQMDPVLASGSWATNDAAGLMTITNLNGTFQIGETVTMSASATSVIVQGFSARDNYLRAFYGYRDACGVPSAQYLDEDKLASPRGSLNWPPENVSEWEAANDYFTLVQWDAVNASVLTAELVTSLDEPNAVIRSWEPELLTDPLGGFTDIELGLHASGKGALNAYFDDFGLKAVVETGSGATQPIQE